MPKSLPKYFYQQLKTLQCREFQQCGLERLIIKTILREDEPKKIYQCCLPIHVDAISSKVVKLLKKQGYLNNEEEMVNHPVSDSLLSDHESLAMVTSSSIAGRIAFDPNAGQKVTRIGSGFGYYEEIPLAWGRRCFSINGFSLHANTSTNTLARDSLKKRVEYISLRPLSKDRLEIIKSGDLKVKLKLKTACSDGTSHLLFTPGEFIKKFLIEMLLIEMFLIEMFLIEMLLIEMFLIEMLLIEMLLTEKLRAIIPPPKSHLVRWSGVFAPGSPYRKKRPYPAHLLCEEKTPEYLVR